MSPSPLKLSVSVYAKASTQSNPGPAAVGVLLRDARGRERELAARIGNSEVNRAHGEAIVRGLAELKPHLVSHVLVYCDCRSTLDWAQPPRYQGGYENPMARVLREAAARFPSIAFEYLSLQDSPEMRRAKALAQLELGIPTKEPSPRRAAATPEERRAAESLLAAADNDSFSTFDFDLGTSLAAQIRQGKLLTEKQWAAAVKLAGRYRGGRG